MVKKKKKSVASYHISYGGEIIDHVRDEVVTTHHITLSEEDFVKEEDVEIAPHELEQSAKTIVDELKEINLGDDANPRPIYVSTLLTEDEEKAYIQVLHERKYVLSWSHKKMPGLASKVTVHQLSTRKEALPVKQTQRQSQRELVPLIEVEVNKLIEINSFEKSNIQH
ncbi:hypothetical protein Sango_2105900 [Sesamum angolense]|uniref:Uncharacterized protein n=1 Tax=Sesamum angolense TaxID=2727404 RepID=A0AAE2BM36_9LAMI|nr:hypothetical protein Sango_2105900 [Sesamum angolense]